MPGRRNKRGVSARELTHEEKIAAVCNLLCAGATPGQMVELMQKEYGVTMSREEPYRLIRDAAARDWLRFIAPRADDLSQKLERRHPWLKRVDVVYSSSPSDVAYQAANLALELIDAHHNLLNKDEVHVGFAAGFSMRLVAKYLAELLKVAEPARLPTLWFHALSIGLDMDNPSTDPSAFFLYLDSLGAEYHELRKKLKFIALRAPAVVGPGQMEGLSALPGVRDAYAKRDRLDIILTSAGCWEDPDNMVSRYPDLFSAQTKKKLEEQGWVGSMLWLPLSANGPIDRSQHPEQATVLVELSDLPGYIRRGAQVVLVGGVCHICKRSKASITGRILNLPDPHRLITHLVTDSDGARTMIDETPERPIPRTA
jgi:DNA-binding transcriptional regulator LsrR (DeoR family)